MQTLRKKTSPCKYKNEPSRFLGDGVSFKAKLIGILEVSEARGDRMCQEALADLKMAIRAAGEHKQRITINIAIDGLRLRDEKTGDSIYHHPVHKISFIAQDMSDSRAFGYIFGSPDTGHRFFGIKTDKAASQVVIAMRDLFQVVFELKKKEIEVAKQHIEQKSRFGSSGTSNIFSDSALSTTKNYQNGDMQHTSTKLSSVSESTTTKVASNSGSESAVSARTAPANESAIADLVDLELELSSIQQGIHQMERITPSDPFGPNKDDPFNNDPFGDSFTSFPQKPFLPPPPSGRERQSRTASETSGSLFSPRTPRTASSAEESGPSLFRASQDEPSSCDWFTPTGGGDSLFEDVPAATETAPANGSAPPPSTHTTAKEPELLANESNASILSQFDVFTELDPLGTGRSKPYVDKKLFFQELKNPPKKVLKDLVTETQPADSTLFAASFEAAAGGGTASSSSSFSAGVGAGAGGPAAVFQTDPFADGDPFDKADPFAEDEFVKAHDPFDTDFVAEFKIFNKPDGKQPPTKVEISDHQPDKLKFPSLHTDKLQPLFPSALSKSPNRFSLFDKQMSLGSAHVSSPRSASLIKQNTFDIKFDSDRKFAKLTQLHENPSLDMSSESECAPEPPPRPATNITPIKPPPLPPKKQPGELSVKPPPRPPHSEESHYDYMESYETSCGVAFIAAAADAFDDTPPIPVPARKSRFDTADFTASAPQRPKKQFQGQSSDEDYLTPVAPPILPPHKKDPTTTLRHFNAAAGPVLLPPPAKRESSKRERFVTKSQVTVASYLESKPKLTSTIASDKLNLTPDTLDITLSQLTLSGLNELANKLNIPASQLSNMTLVQLTTFLSNYVKENNTTAAQREPTATDATFPTFKADFSANFNDLNNATNKAEPYDRYAVFRELLEQEEIGKTSEPTAPPTVDEMIADNEKKETADAPPITAESTESKIENVEFKPTFDDIDPTDRYAALREIIIEDTVSEIKESNLDVVEEKQEDDQTIDEHLEEKQQNDLNLDSLKIKDESDINDKLNREVESNIIEYENSLETTKDNLKSTTPTKSPTLIKSPIPIAITEIIQTNNHLTSGSVSDVISGSSPEIDNAGSTSEAVTKKNVENSARESWAIFDTPNHQPVVKEKQAQSEEGLSPWSSDSKEYVMESPCGWHMPGDSGSEGGWRRKKKKRDADSSWWDTQGETGGHKDKPPCRTMYVRERRSTDSYDDDWYEPERPRRRTRPGSHAWNKSSGAGGQSSSSRDVSPWEEDEPRRCWPAGWRARPPSWDRHRRRDDSWDEEDDYEYEDEYMGKFNWSDRHGSRDSDRASRDSDRHGGPREPPDHWDSGVEQWGEDRRPIRRRAHPQDERWCRPDWDHETDIVCSSNKEKMRYSGSRWPGQEGKWRERERERKRDSDSRYYKRDHSQESPWEDDYSNDPEEPHSPRYLTARRNWKRPSSASEMDRKSGEIKSRPPHYIATGGSDGERDRKYRTNRRSRSKDSQFSDMSHQRHKPDTSQTLGRYAHRNRDKMYSQKFENDFSPQDSTKGKMEVKLDTSTKKSATLGRRKVKDLQSPKLENEPVSVKPGRKQHFTFENDFLNSENDSPVTAKTKFNFENDFETSEAESPVSRYSKSSRGHSDVGEQFSKRSLRTSKHMIGFENDFSKERIKAVRQQMLKTDLQERESKSASSSIHMNVKQKSLFEDDFSPTEKSNVTPQLVEDNGIPVIEEECLSETRVSFTENNLDKTTPSEPRRQSKNILSKSRITNSIRGDINLKKSESVNIFARENDPFDDDFFCGRDGSEIQKVENTKLSPGNVVGEFKWSEDFDNFDIPEESK